MTRALTLYGLLSALCLVGSISAFAGESPAYDRPATRAGSLEVRLAQADAGTPALRPERNADSPLRPERNTESPLRPERNSESPLRSDCRGDRAARPDCKDSLLQHRN
jgi:hypothetical protein